MLEQLAKKDNLWRKIALTICKDKYLADDLVQDMYLKLADNKKQINDFYVIITIRNLFIDYCRESKRFIDITESTGTTFYNEGLTDEEQNIINIANKLDFWKLELLDMSQEHSLRDLEERYNINYGFIYRTIKESKSYIWQEVENQKINRKV